MLPHNKNTYWHEFSEISKYNVSLNYFEKLWAAWYAYMGNDVLATGIMSFVMHEVVYFGRSLPWIIIDQIPAFNKYKIQSVSEQSIIFVLGALADSNIAQDTLRQRTVGLRNARPVVPLHRRTSSNLAVPSDGTVFRLVHQRPVPVFLHHGLPNRDFLRS